MCTLLLLTAKTYGQQGINDTIRLGSITEKGRAYPCILLPEFEKTGPFMDPAERSKRQKLRNDVYTVYPYAITAAAIFKDVNTHLDQMDRRHDRKKYLKSVDKSVDKVFKEPLKNLSIEQGHVLIKLIDRQTGENCYSIIKELKGGFSAVLWQSVGVLFNNNLARDYDPDDRDKEIEAIVQELESSNYYHYQLSQQQALLRKVSKP